MLKLQATVPEGGSLEQVVDEDIICFEEYFKKLGNDPLSKPEKAIIKTYLWFKVQAKNE
jgi:hypothetical protein